MMTDTKRVDRIVIPPKTVRDVIVPWVYKVLLRIKREEAMKKQAEGEVC
jgi:hypothetical protein